MTTARAFFVSLFCLFFFNSCSVGITREYLHLVVVVVISVSFNGIGGVRNTRPISPAFMYVVGFVSKLLHHHISGGIKESKEYFKMLR